MDRIDSDLRDREIRQERWRSWRAWVVLVVFPLRLAMDVYFASSGADDVEARIRVGMTVAEAVMAANRYGRYVQRGCDTPETVTDCTELRFYVRSSPATYRIRVRLDRGRVTSVSRSGPRWFSSEW